MEKVCSQCGAPIEEGAVRCKYCRALLTEEEQISAGAAKPAGTAGPSAAVPPVRRPEENPTPGVRRRDYQVSPQEDAQDHKIHGILAYIGILVVIPIFGAPDSPFARFHANQGLVLFLSNIILTILVAFLNGIPFIGTIYSVARLGILVLMVMGIISAVKCEKKELPLIGNIHLLK